MRRALVPASLAILTALAVLQGSCKTSGEMKGMKPPFGGPEDLSRASELWSSMRGYQNWRPYPGLSGFQPGRSPHGRYLKYYIDSTAAANPGRPGNGSIIVKENYGEENSGSLMAITVMKKVRGYAQQAGRDPAAMGLDGRLRTAGKQPEDWVDEVKSWEEMGANYLSVETRKGGLSGADQHIDAIRRFKDAIGR